MFFREGHMIGATWCVCVCVCVVLRYVAVLRALLYCIVLSQFPLCYGWFYFGRVVGVTLKVCRCCVGCNVSLEIPCTVLCCGVFGGDLLDR